MAPVQTKLTIHPWLDAPLYNRIRYPQWKLYLYNAAQKMCTAMDQTGAFALVALQNDWDSHPKNIIPATVAVGLIAATPASIRQRPIFAMPALYTRNANVYDREMYKLDKERFEKLDEAETTLHAAIVESLFPGTVRTINTATPAGIASLSTVQSVGLVHTLFSTPTLQDIITVNTDLLRPPYKTSKISQITSPSTSITMSPSRVSINPAPTSPRCKLFRPPSNVGLSSTQSSTLGKNNTQTF